MRKRLALLLLVCLLSYVHTYAQNKVSSFSAISLHPTVAYVKAADGNRRVLRLVFKEGKSFNEATATITFNGHTEKVVIPADKAGLEAFEIALPGATVKISTQASVELKANGQTYTANCIVNPARQDWKVYVLPHSHVDIGYTNVQAKVLKLHMDNIDESIELAKKTAAYPKEAQFKWTTEAMWVVENYLKQADPTKKQRFWDAVKKGWISLDGAYGNTNTSLTDSRQLMMMFAEGQKLAKQQGIEIHTMFQGDVPGASWGLPAQTEQTGIKYFLSGPNASDRIGKLAQWQDKPFYWLSPSGKQRLLFWQCQPYSIGYTLKGTKIPNFFTIEDPKPFYTGKPSENFLNPYLFEYLGGLEDKAFPYNMTILTWAMSDNAPIDPELPDAVKAWNERYVSPKLIITSTKQFFDDFETSYKNEIPTYRGDYTEYWTDGVSSAARETAWSRSTSDKIKQTEAIWAINGKPAFPAEEFNDVWKNLLLYNEHTWGAFNSVSAPEDPKVISQWNMKKGYVIHAKGLTDTLITRALTPAAAKKNAIDVYNTLSWPRTDAVYVPADLSSAGDMVTDGSGKSLSAQRLSTGELVFVAAEVPAFGKKTYTISAGKASALRLLKAPANSLSNGIYTVSIDDKFGDITKIIKTANGRNLTVVDTLGFNKYTYMPGDSLAKIQTSENAIVSIKEKGPVLTSLLVKSSAPGANSLQREIRLINGIDRVEIINTIDKKAIRKKESVHFGFPFKVPGAQVRYSIPWGSITAEADQLPNANHNWYTMQRWVDVSNASFGVTWSSPDAPLFEIGKITTGGLLGSLRLSPLWLSYTPQSSQIYSWVMNNLWHTNFRAEQEGVATFRYYLQAHDSGYDAFKANQTGLNNHQPLIAGPAGNDTDRLFFKIDGYHVYVESIKPADDGNGVIAQLVNAAADDSRVNISPQGVSAVKIWESNLTEDKKAQLSSTFVIAGKGIMTVRIEK